MKRHLLRMDHSPVHAPGVDCPREVHMLSVSLHGHSEERSDKESPDLGGLLCPKKALFAMTSQAKAPRNDTAHCHCEPPQEAKQSPRDCNRLPSCARPFASTSQVTFPSLRLAHSPAMVGSKRPSAHAHQRHTLQALPLAQAGPQSRRGLWAAGGLLCPKKALFAMTSQAKAPRNDTAHCHCEPPQEAKQSPRDCNRLPSCARPFASTSQVTFPSLRLAHSPAHQFVVSASAL